MNQGNSLLVAHTTQINETCVNDGKSYHLLLCQHIFDVCCNSSTTFLEDLLCSIQKEKSFLDRHIIIIRISSNMQKTQCVFLMLISSFDLLILLKTHPHI